MKYEQLITDSTIVVFNVTTLADTPAAAASAAAAAWETERR